MVSSIPPSALRPPLKWTPRRRRRVALLLLLICVASFGLLSLLGVHYVQELDARRSAVLAEEEVKADNVGRIIKAALGQLPVRAMGLAARVRAIDFDDESSSPEERAQRMEDAFSRAIEGELELGRSERATGSDLFQFGLGLAPDRHPTKPLFLEYARRRQDGGRSDCAELSGDPDVKSCQELSREFCLCKERVGAELDYSESRDAEYQWYWKARDDGASWVQPYFDPFTGANLTEFSVPIRRGEDFLGVVYANYSTLEMRRLVTEEDLGGTGYVAVVSASGVIVVHPVEDHVANQRKLGDVDIELWRLVEPALSGKSVTKRGYEDPATGSGATVLARPLGAAAGAAVGASGDGKHPLALVVVFDADRGVDLAEERRTLIALINLATLLGIALVLLVVVRLHAPSRAVLWSASALVSTVLFLAMTGIWALTDVHSAVPSGERPPLVSKGRLNSEMDLACKGEEPRVQRGECHVPTGVFLQSVRFSDADTVKVTGYVWQKYGPGLPQAPDEVSSLEQGASDAVPAALHAESLVPVLGPPVAWEPPAASERSKRCALETLKRGFILPEAVDLDTEVAYRRDENGTEVVGWAFKAELRETFTYSTYPLDTKDVWVRLWHEDFSKNVVLVPDLDAYTDLRPSAKPGVERRLVHTGWTVQHSFFSYACASYNTDFGLPDYVGQADFPELYFHLVLRRTFFSAFVKNLVPMLVAAIILFSVLLLVTREKTLANRYGANTAGTMAACSGLFFTVLLAHIQLRSDFAVDGVLYLEWFNFTMYAMILAVAVNAYLFSWNRPFGWIGYQDNLISKLLYWPILLAVLLIATTLSFYERKSGGVRPLGSAAVAQLDRTQRSVHD